MNLVGSEKTTRIQFSRVPVQKKMAKAILENMNYNGEFNQINCFCVHFMIYVIFRAMVKMQLYFYNTKFLPT